MGNEGYEIELKDEEGMYCPECEECDLQDIVYAQVNLAAGDFTTKITCPDCGAEFTLIGERQLQLFLIKE